MSQSRTQELLGHVARRQQFAFITSRFYVCLLIAAAGYLVLLLASRLLGIIPPWFTLTSLVVVPGVALVLAIIFHHRPDHVEAARLVDTKMATKDLFLTTAMIEGALGDYKPLVVQEAEGQAAQIKPKQVVRYQWQREAATVCTSLAVLGAAVFWLPQLDPFGKQVERTRIAEQNKRLKESAKATELRAALLQEKKSGEHTEQVKEAISQLLQAFNLAKPKEPAVNLAKLNEHQKELGQLWKQVSEEKLKNALNQKTTSQSFGLGDQAKSAKLKDDLQKGDTSSTRKELEEIKKLAEQLAATTDPAKKEQTRQELSQRLQNMSDTLAEQLNSQPLNAALARALEQLQMSNMQGVSQDALSEMLKSIDLSKMELNQAGQDMDNMKQLEDAMKTLQSAKMLNSKEQLDGKQCSGCKNLSDYAKMFDSLSKGNQVGFGPYEGFSNEPQLGAGPRPYGSEKKETSFQPLQAQSQLQPGQILMQWKTREVSEAGPAREEFLRAVRDVKQQVSEAISAEQLPPGYHQGIQKYFDSLSENSAKTANP